MRYVKLGKTDLEVSRVSFGAIPIRRLDKERAKDVILKSLEEGINFFDTARVYGDSEEKLGYALHDKREEVYLATKSTSRDAEGAREDLETSLEKLRTDYIDLFQAHNVRTEEAFEETMGPGGALEAMKKAKKEGLIKYIGVTSHDVDISLKTIESGEFVSIMVPYNFMEPEFAEEVIPAAAEAGMGVIVMKPFAGGMIERADLAMRYVLTTSGVTVAIPGMYREEEVEENVEFAPDPQDLNPEELAGLEEFRQEIGGEFCRGCDYCQPCPSEVSISRVLRSERGFRRLGRQWLQERLPDLQEEIEKCEDCGECLPKCPYDLEIPSLMREKVAWLQKQL